MMKNNKTISICIPLYNEEKLIIALLKKVLAVDFAGYWYEREIILVNDGSTDNSEHIVKAFLSKHSLKHILYYKQDNNWKWSAIKKAFDQATWDILVIQDADLEYDPEDILWWIKCIEQWSQLCYWSRIRWFFKRWVVYSTVWFLFWWLSVSWLTSLLVRKLITDEPTCYKMFHKDCKPWLLLPKENGFEREPAITMLLLRKWFTYAEWPIRYYPRKVTAWKKIKLKDWFKALWTLVKWRWKKI
jgi:dolichol-phosphate mannosyltransferase